MYWCLISSNQLKRLTRPNTVDRHLKMQHKNSELICLTVENIRIFHRQLNTNIFSHFYWFKSTFFPRVLWFLVRKNFIHLCMRHEQRSSMRVHLTPSSSLSHILFKKQIKALCAVKQDCHKQMLNYLIIYMFVSVCYVKGGWVQQHQC